MKYSITDYTYNQAKKLGVEVRPSTRMNKKIDVFKNGELLASVGDTRYSDYPHYIKEKGLDYANERRRLYNIRHQKDRKKIGTAGWWASVLLW
jgi:hypothetical protein